MKNFFLTILVFLFAGATVFGIVRLYGIWDKPVVSKPATDVTADSRAVTKPTTVNELSDDVNSMIVSDTPAVADDTAPAVTTPAEVITPTALPPVETPAAPVGNGVTISSPADGAVVPSPIVVMGSTTLKLETIHLRVTTKGGQSLIEVNPAVKADGSFKISINYDFDTTKEGYLEVYEGDTVYQKIALMFE